MLSNSASQVNTPTSVRLQEQQKTLLPPREVVIKAKEPSFEKERQDQSVVTGSGNVGNINEPISDILSSNGTGKESKQPRYARPKKRIDARMRSKTPPPSRVKGSQRRDTTRSPVRGAKPFSGANLVKKMLSPKSQLRSERQNRPSFQGLAVIDGRRKQEDSKNVNNSKLSERKAERRRNSLNFMSKSAQSEQIREMIETTMDGYLDALIIEGSTEERLQAVMTKAKERGMRPDEIFRFFNGGNPNTSHISKETFLESLEKLGDTFVITSRKELDNIVMKFDHNKDGQVSIDEFKNYCYEIPTLPWKAEKLRLERTGELRKLRAQLSRRFTLSDLDDRHSCGEEVYRTSKLFWKANNSTEIRLFYSKDLDVITVQIYSQSFEKELPSIFVCRNKVEYQITKVDKDVTQSDVNDTKDLIPEIDKDDTQSNGNNTNDLDILDSRSEPAWAIIAKYIVIRLKLKSHEEIAEHDVPKLECSHISNEASCIPFLCKLTGDTFDTLMIQKPLNLKPPPSISSSIAKDENFEEKIALFQREARKARVSRQSAQGLTDLVASALSEVEDAIF